MSKHGDDYVSPYNTYEPLPYATLDTISCGKAVGVIRLRVTELSKGYQQNTAMYNLKLAVAVVPHSQKSDTNIKTARHLFT